MVKMWIVGVVVMTLGAVSSWASQGVEPRRAEQLRARQRIFMMEGVLERAVQLGVDNLRRRVRSVMPDDALIQGGAARARGFALDGYGVFFDVEVPALRQSLAWSMRMMQETGMALARDLAQMRSLGQSIADPLVQAEFELAWRRIQRQIGPAPSVASQASGSSGGATPVATQAGGSPEPPTGALSTPGSHWPITDPNEAYTEEVKAAVIDAMIESSAQLALGDQEWLTVAARDNASSGPLMSGDPDTVTLVLRVSGATLNAFRAGRLTLDEVRSRVEVSQF